MSKSENFVEAFLNDNSDNSLEHYGVKGMKWGKKKDKTKTLPIESGGSGENEAQKELDDLEKEIKAPPLTEKQIGESFAKDVKKAETDLFFINGNAYNRSDISSETMDKIEDFVERENKKLRHSFGNDSTSFVEAFLKDNSDDSLEHYGVMGMKWGVRKDRSRSRKSKKSSNTLSNRPKNKKATNEEISSRIKRLELEKKLRNLETELNPKTESWLKNFLIRNGNAIAGNVATSVASAYVSNYLKVNIDKRVKPEYRVSGKAIEKILENK